MGTLILTFGCDRSAVTGPEEPPILVRVTNESTYDVEQLDIFLDRSGGNRQIGRLAAGESITLGYDSAFQSSRAIAVVVPDIGRVAEAVDIFTESPLPPGAYVWTFRLVEDNQMEATGLRLTSAFGVE